MSAFVKSPACEGATCSHRSDTKAAYYCARPAVIVYKVIGEDIAFASRCKEHEHIEPRL